MKARQHNNMRKTIHKPTLTHQKPALIAIMSATARHLPGFTTDSWTVDVVTVGGETWTYSARHELPQRRAAVLAECVEQRAYIDTRFWRPA